LITLADIKKDPEIDVYFQKTNKYLSKMGVIDHDYGHANKVAENSRMILEALNFSDEDIEMAAIAGYLHDIGNVINRYDHGRIGAVLVFTFLLKRGVPQDKIAHIVSAIGNHEEKTGTPVSSIGAAVIISDKADVHRDRVRKTDFATFTTRDRVNYAVERSTLKVDQERRIITMELTIDLTISSVMEYFEIFLTRMVLSRRAASHLGCDFELIINEARFL
jgi:HD superfamily phosphodiesterase